jgi:hypothetical protein
MIRRIGLASLLTLTGLVLAAGASPATAAVTLGQTADPNAYCGSNTYLAQTAVGGSPGYAVPGGYGVITSWSFKGYSSNPGTGRLLVWRPTGTADQYTLTHKSPVESFIASTIATFPVQFPVEPNDVLGLACSQPGLLLSTLPGDVIRYVTTGTEPAEGSVQTLSGMLNEDRLLVSANVEPDTDKDTFGDETQDKCIGTAGQFNGCPNVVTVSSVKQKGRKPKVKVSVEVPGPGTLRAGSPSDPTLATAAKVSLKPVTLSFSATNKQAATFVLKLTKSAKSKLAKKGKLKIQVKFSFTPTGGPAGSQIAKAKLKS